MQPGRHAVGKALLPPTKAGAPRRVVSQVPFGVPFWRVAGRAARPIATTCALRVHSNPATSAPRRPHLLFLPASILAQPQSFGLNSEAVTTSFFRPRGTSGHVRARSRDNRSRAGGLGARGSASGARGAWRLRWWLLRSPPNCTAGMVRVEGGVQRAGLGRGGPGPPPPRSSALLFVLPVADEPDDPRPGAGALVRACVGATLVGGGDPQEQPKLVAGG